MLGSPLCVPPEVLVGVCSLTLEQALISATGGAGHWQSLGRGKSRSGGRGGGEGSSSVFSLRVAAQTQLIGRWAQQRDVFSESKARWASRASLCAWRISASS